MLTEEPPVFAIPEDFVIDEAKLVATRRRLEAAGVEFCFSTYVDIHGVPKAKTNPLAAFEKMAHGSELFTVGAMEGMGLIGPHEDECAAVPDLNTLIVCPWNKKIGYFFGDLYYHGAPYQNDSRQILKRQLHRAAALGFQMNLGMETEFYVVRIDEERSRRILARDRYQGTCPAYDIYQTLGSMAFLEPMSNYMDELGWNLYSFDQEGGHSQFEFDFKYTDALTMCDRFIFLRLMAKQVAEQIGATATFLPKPFANDFRSACHFNMSLADVETGSNRFAPETDLNALAQIHGVAMSKLAYHFAAGVLRHAAAITAVTSPTYNSYQGLIAQGDMPDISWAPVIVAYGRNNRSAMLRLPLNRYCVENRAPDISCNPYLAAAVQLAAGLEGIEQELDPGKPLNQNCYDLTRSELKEIGMKFLPRTLLHSLEAFEADPLIDQVFGTEFKEIYLKQKLKEWDEGFYPISEAHLQKHLTFI
jgi:glutamine synthetase